MQGNGKGVLLFNASKVLVSGNAMTGSTDTHGAAIRIEGGSSDVTVFRNTIAFNLGGAIRVSKIFGDANSRISITENNLYSNSGGGLIVDSHGYKGTLDATNNWWGSDQGPGVGDAVLAPDRNVRFDPWATSLVGSTPTKTSTPLGLRKLLLADLVTIRRQVPKKLREFIDEAGANLRASLASGLWIDDSHLAAGAGQTMFKLDGKAVGQLWHLIKEFKKSPQPAGLLATIQRVANLERMMAMIAIDGAGNADPKLVAHANAELSAGADAAARGKYADAITHFLASWKIAIQG